MKRYNVEYVLLNAPEDDSLSLADYDKVMDKQVLASVKIYIDDFGRRYGIVVETNPPAPPFCENPAPGVLSYGDKLQLDVFREEFYVEKIPETEENIRQVQIYVCTLDQDVQRELNKNPDSYDAFGKGYRAASKEWRKLYNLFKKEGATFHHYIGHKIPRKLREQIEIKMNLAGVDMGHLKWWNPEEGHWDFPEDPRCLIYPRFEADFTNIFKYKNWGPSEAQL